ncbi:MAG: hypothetical protein M3Q29_25905 [Chloroflexota bacterium]|nr:hypothetical protein [Chloroflexota bacterium]
MAGRDLRRSSQGAFPGSPLRQLLYAIHATATDPDRDPRTGRTYLRQEMPSYWQDRLMLADILSFLVAYAGPLPHWRADAEAAKLLRESILNDSV